MNLYGFAFQLHNISSRTLYSLEGLDHRTLLWGVKSIENYVAKLLKEQPDFILGLGIYTGRNKEYLHLETKAINKFRKATIEPSGPSEINFSPFLQKNGQIRYSETIGNSFCNLVTWKVVQEIKKGNLISKYSFVHIARNFDEVTVKREIQQQLDQL